MGSLVLATAFGPCLLGWSDAGLTTFRFLGNAPVEKPSERAPMWVFDAARRLTDHLAGRPADLMALPLDLSGLTPFQREVAKVLRATRPGETISYGDVALRLGKPGAARAVGRAVKANPLLLLIPCHRVVAKDGEGGWSAFGSADLKQRLRALEAPARETQPGHTGAR